MKRWQYLAVQSRPGRLHGRRMLLLYRPNGLDLSRMGITATRRVAGAVGRNRFKRLVREAFRLRRSQVPPGWDLVVIARNGAPAMSWPQLSQELWEMLERLPEAPAA
ncbi:MAG: ribonuclease P protein component [Desulfarculaceae bacterium]|nr:ribonuclease P protein component [Desulfarculaceae bacterium]MCF8073632.1 ribonuclease P protein component [Desulfarculaceae bacterium]